MHRTLDRSKLSTALARAAIEELRPQALPREFVSTFCARCDHEETRPGPATAAAATAQAHYTALAREAALLSALREACNLIEASAKDAFFRTGMSQQEFEEHWRHDELQRWGHWTRLKEVAGMEQTRPELAGGDDD